MVSFRFLHTKLIPSYAVYAPKGFPMNTFYFLSYYLLYAINYCEVFISLSRTTSVWMPMQHGEVPTNQRKIFFEFSRRFLIPSILAVLVLPSATTWNMFGSRVQVYLVEGMGFMMDYERVYRVVILGYNEFFSPTTRLLPLTAFHLPLH